LFTHKAAVKQTVSSVRH